MTVKKHKPTLLVLENYDTYSHVTYQHADIWTMHADGSLTEGLPDRPALFSTPEMKKILRNRYDHGGLVLNRVVGHGIGIAPDICVIYASIHGTFTGSSHSMEEKKRLDRLEQILTGKQHIDAISVSDAFSKIWDADMMKNECVNNYLSFYWFVREYFKEDKGLSELKDEFKDVLSQKVSFYQSLHQAVGDKDVQFLLKNIRQKVKLSVHKHSHLSTEGTKIQNALDMLIKKDQMELPCLLKTQQARKEQIEKARPLKKRFEKLCVLANEKGIALFSVDMASRYGFGVHGLNQDDSVYQLAEDPRMPFLSRPQETLLFVNQKIDFPDSCLGYYLSIKEEGRGGLSSLIPTVAGLFVKGRSVKSDLTPQSFFSAIKRTGYPFLSDNQPYGGYAPNIEAFCFYLKTKQINPNNCFQKDER